MVTFNVYFATAPDSRWFDECVIADPASIEPSSAVYANYLEWAKAHGIYGCSHKSFSKHLQAKGFKFGRTSRARYIGGLRLKQAAAEPTL